MTTHVNAPKRPRPKNWAGFRASIQHRWATPFLAIDWVADWAAYGMAHLSLVELLEYLGSFTVLVAVIFYFKEAPERTKIKHYQAWQVINTAQDKGGSGGRIEAMHELNEDGVPLVGVDVSNAFLEEVGLENADLRRSTFGGADLKLANFHGARLGDSRLRSANLRQANLSNADLSNCILSDADLGDANLRGTNVLGTDLDQADLRGADLANLNNWRSLGDLRLTNVHNVQNAPDGFVAWALSKGAVDLASDGEWAAAIEKANTSDQRASTQRANK